jgi:hypothetical protein
VRIPVKEILMPKTIAFNASIPDVVPQGAAFLTLLTHPEEMLAEAGNTENEQIGWHVHDSLCVAAYCARATADPLSVKCAWPPIGLDARSKTSAFG